MNFEINNEFDKKMKEYFEIESDTTYFGNRMNKIVCLNSIFSIFLFVMLLGLSFTKIISAYFVLIAPFYIVFSNISLLYYNYYKAKKIEYGEIDYSGFF